MLGLSRTSILTLNSGLESCLVSSVFGYVFLTQWPLGSLLFQELVKYVWNKYDSQCISLQMGHSFVWKLWLLSVPYHVIDTIFNNKFSKNLTQMVSQKLNVNRLCLVQGNCSVMRLVFFYFKYECLFLGKAMRWPYLCTTDRSHWSYGQNENWRSHQ